jgi:hypothetical protein
MAFSSGILSSSIGDASILQAALDSKLPARWTSSQSASQKDTGGTGSDLTLDTVSVTNVETSDLLIFLFQHSYSIGDTSALLKCWSTIGGTDMQNYAWRTGRNSNISANEDSMFTIAVTSGLSGTVAFAQKMVRSSGTGTMYSKDRQYHIIQLKFRA